MKVKNLALTERPMKFDEVIGQDIIIGNLKAQSRENKFFQTYLLYGHYGCGKTTVARILAAAVNCSNRDESGNPCGVCPNCMAVRRGCTDVMEIDGASNTGIDNIRQLKETAEYLPTVLEKKVYIIDEVHKLSDSAFNALLKVLEEPPAHVVFILATTDRDKIPATVLSRLAKYEFKRIPTNVLVRHLSKVAERNRYSFTEEGIATIARNSDGSVRNAIKMLEIVSELSGGVTEENAVQMIGLSDPADVFGFLELILSGDYLPAFYKASEMSDIGWDPRNLASEMIRICSDAVLAQERMDLIDASEQYKILLEKICQKYTCSRFIEVLDYLNGLARQLRESSGDRACFKNGILLLASNPANRLYKLEEQVKDLVAQVEYLQQSVLSGVAGGKVQQILMDKDSVPCDVSDSDEENLPWNEDVVDDCMDGSASDDKQGDIGEEELEQKESDSMNSALSGEGTGKEQVGDVENKNLIDPFAPFRIFSFAGNSTAGTDSVIHKEPDKREMEDAMESDAVSDADPEHIIPPACDVPVDDYLADIEVNQPVLDNLLTLGFERLKDGETTVFETDEPAFFEIGKAYAGAMGGFPFALRQA